MFNIDDNGLEKINLLDKISKNDFYYTLGISVKHVIFCEQNFQEVKNTDWDELYQKIKVSGTQFLQGGHKCKMYSKSSINSDPNFDRFQEFEPKAMCARHHGYICPNYGSHVKISNKRSDHNDSDLIMKIVQADEMNWNDQIQKIELPEGNSIRYEFFERDNYQGKKNTISSTTTGPDVNRMSSIRIAELTNIDHARNTNTTDNNLIQLQKTNERGEKMVFSFDIDDPNPNKPQGKIKKLDMDDNYTRFVQKNISGTNIRGVYCEKLVRLE